jgi:nucleoside-diphosphate-sugar epimerase
MHVFLTGATGFVGSAIAGELRTAGHTVLGLARNDAGAEALTKQGIAVHRGDLSDTDSLASGARACDGVIHTAFIHDFSQHVAACETDRSAVKALVGALEGTGKPLLVTSGTGLLAHGRMSTEEDAATVGPRAPTEQVVLDAAGRGVRAMIVRLPASTHGAGDHGFVPALIDFARRKGVAAFIGDGANRWPAAHRFDAARLYRLALEKGTPGMRLHAVAEEAGIPMRAIAELIGEKLGVPVHSIAAEEAPAHFDWMARFAAMDIRASSARTRSTLGWQPTGPDLLTDMRENGYF